MRGVFGRCAQHRVTKWASEINVAIRWESLKFHSKALPDFHGALLFFLLEGTVPKRHINWQQFHPDAIPDTTADPKRQRRNERKAPVADKVTGLATTYLCGTPFFFLRWIG